jgi:hypothetical protein
VILVVTGSSVYANLSFLVKTPVYYKYFPPFFPHHNANMNHHLGAEYFCIAQSIVNGDGFASPFHEKTGPTAWMPPILPAFLACLLWICDGNRDAVMWICIVLQSLVLIATGLLIVILSRQTTARLWTFVAVAFFLLLLLCDFRTWFQATHDCSLILLFLDLTIAGFAWCKPMQGWKSASLWGVFGGLCAMASPIVALVWGVLTLVLLVRERTWVRFAIAATLAAVVLTPWVVRNYMVFGKFIPVKSNAAYELYQSQCLTPDGLLQPAAFGVHPYGRAGKERRLYKELGEIDYLEKKRELFLESVQKDPVDFVDRIACRFLGATLWYVPFNRAEEERRPWTIWFHRCVHPLPFLAFLALIFTAVWRRLDAAQWGVIAVYVFYLLPYVAISYYDRYAVPLLAAKVLLMIWGLDRLLAFLPHKNRNVEAT